LRLDTRVSHATLNECYHFNRQMSLDRDGRQCMSAGITYSYCRLRPIIRDVDQFIQVAMGMKQWDCVSFFLLLCLHFFDQQLSSIIKCVSEWRVQFSAITQWHRNHWPL